MDLRMKTTLSTSSLSFPLLNRGSLHPMIANGQHHSWMKLHSQIPRPVTHGWLAKRLKSKLQPGMDVSHLKPTQLLSLYYVTSLKTLSNWVTMLAYRPSTKFNRLLYGQEHWSPRLTKPGLLKRLAITLTNWENSELLRISQKNQRTTELLCKQKVTWRSRLSMSKKLHSSKNRSLILIQQMRQGWQPVYWDALFLFLVLGGIIGTVTVMSWMKLNE